MNEVGPALLGLGFERRTYVNGYRGRDSDREDDGSRQDDPAREDSGRLGAPIGDDGEE
jgi:hypothetical protein